MMVRMGTCFWADRGMVDRWVPGTRRGIAVRQPLFRTTVGILTPQRLTHLLCHRTLGPVRAGPMEHLTRSGSPGPGRGHWCHVNGCLVDDLPWLGLA